MFRPDGSKVPVIYATGSDKSIREITVTDNNNKTTELRYEEGTFYSQILVG